MRLNLLIAATIAELRTASRLTRTRLFIVLAVLTTFGCYFAVSGFHAMGSVELPRAFPPPRFLISGFGSPMLWLLLAGTVFMAFDIGVRDRRERIADVLDSRPVANVYLLGGRLCAVVLTAWVPVVFAAVAIQLYGVAARAFEWPFGDVVEPASLIVFLTVDALPALAVWAATVMLLAAVLRNRLAVATVAMGLLGLHFWWLSTVPPWLLALFAFAPDRLVSDLTTSVPDARTFLQRGSVLLCAVGFLFLAAVCVARRDSGSRLRCAVTGAALAVVGFAGIGVAVQRASGDLDQRATWLAAHQQARDPNPEIEQLRGDVVIDPGRGLDIDVELRLAWRGEAHTRVVFSFNPGMVVEELAIDGQPASFEHRDGLLTVERPTASAFSMTLRAGGVPDSRFAYLDDMTGGMAVDVRRRLHALGSKAALFEREFVALMPGAYWLPVPGPALARDGGRDFFTVDLTVQAPTGWLVAGPGRRQPVGGSIVRFASVAPVPEVGLIASRFERRATVIDGIEFELLLNPAHTASLDFLADAGAALVERLNERLDLVNNTMDLAYPYDALSVVEVPTTLRGYGGGWRMPSVLALPGVLLLPEDGFPTARFRADDEDDGEGAEPASVLRAVENQLRRDISGGNPFAGVARNLFLFQTGAKGAGAAALEFVCHELTMRLLVGDQDNFSARIYSSAPSIKELLVQTFAQVLNSGSGSSAVRLFGVGSPTPAIWDRASGQSLAALDTTDPAGAVNVLSLKGTAFARAIIDGLGVARTSRLLAELRRRYMGRTFTTAEFAALDEELGGDVEALLGDWLHETALPGFLVSPVTHARLPDTPSGQPRYQATLHVRNNETVPGVARLRYRMGREETHRFGQPFRVDATASAEVGLVTAEPLSEVWLESYLSMNRRPVRLRLIDEGEAAGMVSFAGTQPSVWQPAPTTGIVVDDLDAGFSVFVERPQTSVRLAGVTAGLPDQDLDQGLPVYDRSDNPARLDEWARAEQPSSWGAYRHTVARASAGGGEHKAMFTVDLPSRGRWRLAYHLPDLSVRHRRDDRFDISVQIALADLLDDPNALGSYDMTLRAGSAVDATVDFDGSAAQPGWNAIGEFDLEAGLVSLIVSNRTDGQFVVADAVRWTRAR